ncbi:unnamed protein product [Thelazia callipaeda]|uniref:MFS domain-containing protein n=1 Tax=Thelazia callipaeda TaxID=103827 RepID=A0A0N5D6Q4_THECL|nr:unnamed protein product [Thelazia callipaeda]
MVFAPVCGYFGDRYNRKLIMQSGLIIWTLSVLLSTFCSPAHFYLFMLCRGIVGIGEASFATVAPTIIADMFEGNQRSTALMVFYFAIPIGSGLGFISGATISLWTGVWQWGVRLTSILGVISFLLLYHAVEEPVRSVIDDSSSEESYFFEDVKYLLTVPTFITTTIGLTAVVFMTGCVAWWAPTLMEHAWAVQHSTSHVSNEIKARIGLVFGLITCLAGFVGVLGGSALSQMWRSGFRILPKNLHADPHVCALGAFLAIPFLYLALVLSPNYTAISLVFTFLGTTCCCMNWAVNMDILMYVVSLRRRSIASATQTLISHLFGDASSPYIVGLISDRIREVTGNERSVIANFIALQRSLFVPNFVLCLGGFMYLVSTFYIDQDKENADRLTIGTFM